ncbi:ATP-binding protein [Candidatus Woesearchaeota archaeon]|nr:ATP-binding protein [Candidatus Woesearchaeota archaeon]
MDAKEQIQKFNEFFDTNYRDILLSAANKGEEHISIPFSDLARFDVELAEDLLETPEDVIKAAEYSISKFEFGVDDVKLNVRFFDLPSSSHLSVRDIRSKNLNKMYQFKGLVRQKSDVRPQVTSARFECPSCGNIIPVLQLDQKFREPNSCNVCGRKGKFNLLSKELVDAQKIVLEEDPEDMQGGEQPKRINIFLKNDLVSPISDKKTNPGSKIVVTGVIKEVPITLQTGGKSTRYELMLEVNYINPLQEEFETLEVSKEKEKEILALSKDPQVYDKLVRSIAPSIYGHDRIKEALLLQMFGGRLKEQDDGVKRRGDIHILLIGDPGCIHGTSQVATHSKGMVQIKDFGIKHKQKIKEALCQIRKGPNDKPYAFTSNFQHYKKQPVLKIKTETGKEMVCTFNQPFMTKKGWTRADHLSTESKIRVMPKIPNNVKKLVDTDFKKITAANQSKVVVLPKKLTKELAGLYGYILGDGNIHSKKQRISCYVNEEELDLIDILSKFVIKEFGIKPSIYKTKNLIKETEIKEKGKIRKINREQKLTTLDINSKIITNALSFLSEKKVPQKIFSSKKEVVSEFLSWIFEADGCVFGKGRGSLSVQLKSKNEQLLKDVQILLLYFGIQGRIIEDNLTIRRSSNIKKFAKEIGFQSKKKKEKLRQVLDYIKIKNNQQMREKPQTYERVVSIELEGFEDVYDFEVPSTKSFIANGILCHNSGKSQLLKRVSIVAPKTRFVSGKGASGAGLTAAVVRDEFTRGWALEAGALVLANKGMVCIDELDKMSAEDTSAMHEALEQQSISISKANIQATLRSETTVLAAANPKFGRFDPYEVLVKQIDLPPPLINRFDLIFPVKDLPDKDKDERLASFILKLHKDQISEDTPVSSELIKLYVAYAKQRIQPVLTEPAMSEIKDYFVSMRNSGSGDEKIKSVPISARQLEGLVRLSEASAKTRLSKTVTKADARRAIDLLHHCLTLIGLDEETGKFDIDRIATGITATQRGNVHTVKEIIVELEKALNTDVVPIEDIIREAEIKGMSGDKTEEILNNLKRKGDIFNPKHGVVKRM